MISRYFIKLLLNVFFAKIIPVQPWQAEEDILVSWIKIEIAQLNLAQKLLTVEPVIKSH
jgi:hypothetical protein